jgi:hypothetical protein
MNIMAELYGQQRPAVRLVAAFGVGQTTIPLGLASIDLWDFLLDELAKIGKLRECIQAVISEYPGNQHVPFLKKLLSAPRKIVGMSGDFDPWEYLGLFNRTTESDLLAQMLFQFTVPPAIPPIVIGILAERADEHDYFVQHITSGILGRLLGNTSAVQPSDLLDWAPDARITADWEIRKIAERKVGNQRDNIDNVIARLGPALAGRTTILALSTEHLTRAGVSAKLAEFLAIWSKFGLHSPPLVLYVIIIRYDDTDLSLADAEPLLASVFATASNNLTVVRPVTAELGRKFDMVKFYQFKKAFNATFPLSICEMKDFDGWQICLTA